MKKKDVIHFPVKGDGNCLFHAVVKYLKLDRENGHSDQKETSHNLRLKVIDWLKNNLNLRIDNGLTIEENIELLLDDSNVINTVPKYLKNMSKNKIYGGQIEIFAISYLLNRNIKTFIYKDNRYRSIGLGNKIKQGDNDTIHLYHNLSEVGTDETGHHFEILYPKNKIQPKKKENKSNKTTTKNTRRSTRRSTRRNTRRSNRRSNRRSTRRSNRKSNRSNNRRSYRKRNRKSNRITSRKTNRRRISRRK